LRVGQEVVVGTRGVSDPLPSAPGLNPSNPTGGGERAIMHTIGVSAENIVASSDDGVEDVGTVETDSKSTKETHVDRVMKTLTSWKVAAHMGKLPRFHAKAVSMATAISFGGPANGATAWFYSGTVERLYSWRDVLGFSGIGKGYDADEENNYTGGALGSHFQ